MPIKRKVFPIRFGGRSLRTELFLIICLAGILPGIVLCLIILRNYEKEAISSRMSMVTNQCHIISDHLYSGGYPDITDNAIIDSELMQLSNLYDGRVLVTNSDLKIIKDTYSLSEGKYMISPEVIRGLGGEGSATYDDRYHYIEIITPISDRGMKEFVGVMLTSVSTAEIDDIIKSSRRLASLIMFAMIAVVIGIAFLVSLGITSQFGKLTRTIANIKEGFEEEKIDAFSYRETSQIMEAFNQLLLRMKTLDDSRSEFVANVSHELKTPITSIKVLAQSLTSQDDVPEHIYREFMEDIAAEVDREDRIITDLLSLVRMDRAGVNLQIAVCDIDEMLEGVIKRLSPIADAAKVELVFETVRPAIAEVDEQKLSLAFTNIIENGIKYNREGGSVKVTLDSEPLMFVVVVEDTGIGIPEEDIPHIFERFYRVDKSHSREIGGTGLGLALARNAIIMHKGAVKVESTVGVGSRFDIKIPLSYIITPVADKETELKGAEDEI